jgi:hypothetical protein
MHPTRDRLIKIIERTENEIGSDAAADEILALLREPPRNHMDVVWPDEDELNVRRTMLMADVVAFIAPEARKDGNGGYAPCDDADIRALNALIREIIDMRFVRDSDRGQVVDFATVNRLENRLHTFYEPHSPDMRDEASPSERTVYAMQIATVAGLMAAETGRMLNQLGRRMQFQIEADDKKALQDAEARRDMEAAELFVSLVSTRPFHQSLSDYRSAAAELGPRNEAVKLMRDALAKSILPDTENAAIHIDRLIDENKMDEAIAALEDGFDKWFRGAFSEQRERINTYYRGLRERARRAKLPADPAWQIFISPQEPTGDQYA